METVIAFLEQTLKRDQAIKDALPDIKALYNISAQVKELEVRKDALQIDLEARTEALKAAEVESTVQKEKAASALAGAVEQAKLILNESRVVAAGYVSKAKADAEDIITVAKDEAWHWDQEVKAKQYQAGKAKDEFSDWQQKLINVQAQLASLKANL